MRNDPPSKKTVEDLKSQHPVLYLSQITLPEKAGGGLLHVVWRPPKLVDWDRYQSAIGKDGVSPNRELLAALAVWPELPKVVLDIQDTPIALGVWVEQEVLPFFGSGTTVTSAEL